MSTSERILSRGLLFCAAFGALFCFASTSHADSHDPTIVQQQLALPCPPPCTICHQDLAGGIGTVVKPFGMAMRGVGLTFNYMTLPDALVKLEATNTDSNGDGTPDIMQLRAAEDPNTGKAFCGADAPLTPQYGCGAHIASVPAGDHSAPIAALLAAAVLGASAHRAARRRRRAGASRQNR